jgi:hypothetical protein
VDRKEPGNVSLFQNLLTKKQNKTKKKTKKKTELTNQLGRFNSFRTRATRICLGSKENTSMAELHTEWQVKTNT